MQLALSQQILLGDEVIVGDDNGVIEEITSSYVVIRTGELRRLIIPLRFFMENSFKNLTYHETDAIGAVLLYTDYNVDIPAIRAEADRLVKASSYWDGKRFDAVVSDSRENVIEIKISVSAKDTNDLNQLRWELREAMIIYLQQHQPDAVPRTRLILEPGDELAVAPKEVAAG